MNKIVYFEVGDVVQLKSGGPAMTCVEVIDGLGVYCEWFNEKNELQKPKLFPLLSLKRGVALSTTKKE